MEQVWATISPYVMSFINILLSTGIGGILVGLIGRKIISKVNANEIIGSVSNAITDGIITRDIKVDLQSYNKEQIERIKRELLAEFVNAFKTIHNQTVVLSDIAQVVMKFKAVSEEEKVQIIEHLQSLTNTEVIVEKAPEPVIVKIKPVKEKTDNETLDLFN